MPQPPKLIKTQIAGELRERIFRGELRPGEIISETQWSARLGTAQASVREALNLLVGEGLVRKEPGRSARVTMLTERDVAQAYELRAVMEGLAARLLAERKADVSELEAAIVEMERSAGRRALRKAIDADLRFHLLLCGSSGNVFLAQQAKKLLVPLFAFTMIRTLANREAARAWVDAAADHRLIVAAIRSGDPVYAEQTAHHVIGRFGAAARDVWVAETG